MATHKGSEFNNINETWNRNEQSREGSETGGADNISARTPGVNEELARTIKEEAAEYDNANKEQRVLDGDRATVNDSRDESSANEG